MKNTDKLSQHIFIKDNLEVLRALDSESVDLIYLDPPFQSNRNYSAPLGSQAAGAHFKDTWTLSDTDRAWHGQIAEHHPALFDIIRAIGKVNGDKDKSYLIYMAMRLLEMHMVLKPTGSIYLHCDPTMSHGLKLVMDSVFGKTNFRNEVVWCYRGMPAKANKFQQKHDTIFYYTKSDSYPFNLQYDNPTPESEKTYKHALIKGYNANLSKNMVTIFNDNKYRLAVKNGKLPKGMYEKKFTGGKPPMKSWWEDIKVLGGHTNKERTGYPTQKPLALLERIIKASSNEGDLVLDPFCGSGTTCVASEKLNRRWIGIDLSDLAGKLVKQRILRQFEQGTLGKELVNPIVRKTLPIKDAPKMSKNIKHIRFGEQEGYCNGCNVEWPIRALEKDHIIARDIGGQDTDKNIHLLCGNCNRRKGNKSMSNLYSVLKKDGLITENDVIAVQKRIKNSGSNVKLY